jgi:hypothetical protein
MLQGVLTTYDGPLTLTLTLTLAMDNMVWNITMDSVVVRDIVSPGQAWAPL